MNRTLFKLALREAWAFLAIAAGLLVVFSWLFVFIMKDVSLPAVFQLFDFALPVLGLPMSRLASPEGTFSVVYVDAPTLILCVAWAVTRGSDAVSGQLGRGVLETVLAQPISRSGLLAVHTLVTTLGALVLAAAVWAGIALGLWSFGQLERVSPWSFLPGSINLFFFMLALAGITTMVSAFETQRWRTIGVVVGFYVVSVMLKVLARLWPQGGWLSYLSLPAAYEPQRLIVYPERMAEQFTYNGTLLVVAVLSYLVAFLWFARRDLPPPP